MNAIKKLFWWIDSSGENRFSLVSVVLMSVFWLTAATVAIFVFGKKLSASEDYAVYAGVTIYAFVQLSSELSLLARSEAFRLLPGFESRLVTGARTCVLALVAGVAAINFLGESSYELPFRLSTTAYAAAVLAGLQLPAWGLQRRVGGGGFNTKYVGNLNLSWPTMLALAVPALALHWVPVFYVSMAMVIVAATMLWAMPHLLRARKVDCQTTPSGSLWRRPGVVIFGVVSVLILAPLAQPWTGDHAWAPAMLILALPWMGATAMGRESQKLPGLLGRMWLAGRSRAELCWIGLRRLLIAQASEFGIYLGVATVGCALGLIALPTLFNLALILIAYGWINWTRGVNDILLGTESRRLRMDKPVRKGFKLGFVVLPFVAIAVLASVFPSLFVFPLDKRLVTVMTVILSAFGLLVLLSFWSAWQQRVGEFSASNAEDGWRISSKLKAQLIVILMNLPSLALILMVWLERTEGLIFAIVTALFSVAITLNYFHRRFETAELW